MRPPIVPGAIPLNIAEYLRDLAKYVSMALQKRTPDDQARASIILLSPNGSAWEVKVSDTGVVTTTKVAG